MFMLYFRKLIRNMKMKRGKNMQNVFQKPQPRDSYIQIRVTEDQKSVIDNLAYSSIHKNTSAWIMALIKQEHDRITKNDTYPKQF